MLDILGATISGSMSNVARGEWRVIPSAIATKDERDCNTAGSFFCPQCILCKPCPAVLNSVKGVVRTCRSDVIQIEVGDKPKRSFQQVTAYSHPIIHINLVVDSGLYLQ